MTSDATLELSSCANNTPTIGLRRFQGTKGLDLVGIFYVAVPLRIVESALVPYPYPGFCNTWNIHISHLIVDLFSEFSEHNH